MNEYAAQHDPFQLDDAGPLQWGLPGLEWLLGLRRCRRYYRNIAGYASLEEFTGEALEQLGIEYRVTEEQIRRIPAAGPCILVANHPYGGLDGLILLNLLSRRRQDLKVVGNYLLERIPQLKPCLVAVDPFNRPQSGALNLSPLRRAVRHLRNEGILVVFPAGEVSSRQKGQAQVCDRPWNDLVGRLVRLSRASVVPVYFPGDNGWLFQLAGRIHERLRTALLPKMLLRRQGQRITLAIGRPLPAGRLLGRGSDRAITDYVRLRTYALDIGIDTAAESGRAESGGAGHDRQPVGAALPAELLEREISRLPDSCLLLESGDFSVLHARAAQIPWVLREIGRLREITFRAAGEGTGRAFDLDAYDQDYLHLFIWNRTRRELVGAYRIGEVDRLLARKGPAGLYSCSLFRIRKPFLARMKNALELGRSFVRPEYQKSFAPLLLLWKGIGAYLVARPRYRYLFGPVSISDTYSSGSRRLLTDALRSHYQVAELARLISPRTPVRFRPVRVKGNAVEQLADLLRDMDEISTLVADFETDGKGMPVLLRHYLSLGGRLLAFNRDPQFSDVIDGLLLVDLPAADHRQLKRYLGAGWQGYLAHQKRLAEPAPDRETA